MAFGFSTILSTIKEKLTRKQRSDLKSTALESQKIESQTLLQNDDIQKEGSEDTIAVPNQNDLTIAYENDGQAETILEESVEDEERDMGTESAKQEERDTSDWETDEISQLQTSVQEIITEIDRKVAAIKAEDFSCAFSQEDAEDIQPDGEQKIAEEMWNVDNADSAALNCENDEVEQEGADIEEHMECSNEHETNNQELSLQDGESNDARDIDKEVSLFDQELLLEEDRSEDAYNEDGEKYENEKELSFADKYHIDLDRIDDMPVEFIAEIPVRLKHALMKAKKRTFKEFLQMTAEDLSSLKNVGSTSIQAADAFFSSYAQTHGQKEQRKKKHSDSNLSDEFKQSVKDNLTRVQRNDWGFLSKDRQKRYSEDIARVRSAQKELDADLFAACFGKPGKIKKIYEMLDEFSAPFTIIYSRKEQIEKICKSISDERLHQLVKPYIEISSLKEYQKLILEKFDADTTVEGFFHKAVNTASEAEWTIIISFAERICFDLTEEISSIERNLFKNEREKEVLYLRSNGCTLEEIGAKLNITRERVRQIEQKVRSRRFETAIIAGRICEKIYASSGMKPSLSEEEMEGYFSVYKKECINMLKSAEELLYRYDAESGAFYNINRLNDYNEVDQFLDQLPGIMWVSEVGNLIEELDGYKSLDKAIIKERIAYKYNKSRELYHLGRLKKSDAYQMILKRFYPEGIMVYEHEDLERFRRLAKEHIGITDLPTEDRALGAGITKICVLCGKGRYKLRQEKYIPKRLLNDIEGYILSNKGQILFIGAVYDEFENRLTKYGVDNRFYFQGILRQCQSGKIFMTKDYVSSQPMELTVVDSIVEYIRECGTITSKEKIEQKFKGLGPVIYSFVSSHHKIINMFGQYLHVDNVKATEGEKRAIDQIIKRYVLGGQGYAHGKDLMPVFEEKVPVFLTRNGINYAYQLVNLLGAVYYEKCVVRKPFIAKKGAVINRPKEQLDEVISNDEVINISTIKEAAAELHYVINSTVDFLAEYADSHLLINSKQIASYSYIGMNQAIINQVVQTYEKVVDSTIPINELSVTAELPQLKVPWNEWLVFSIIRHASDKLEVATSKPQLRESVAVIAPKGSLMLNPEIESLVPNEEGNLSTVDNLDNIDDLIEEFIDEEIEF